jgi:hypothetical protein
LRQELAHPCSVVGGGGLNRLSRGVRDGIGHFRLRV